MSEKSFNVAETARKLGVSPQTAKRLIKSGRLRGYAIYTGKQCRYRVMESDLEAFIKNAERVAAGWRSPDGQVSYL